MKKWIVLLVVMFLIGCGGQVAESDSDKEFATIRGGGLATSIDFGVYTITGYVEPMLIPIDVVVGYTGETSPVLAEYPYRVMDGKSLLRVEVVSAEYTSSTVKVDILQEVEEAIDVDSLLGQVIVVKITDAKMFGVLIGDKVKLSCRAEPENLAAVANNEPFQHALETWELDWCRFASPVVDIEE